ncbi:MULTISPECIES: VOC family protein [Halorussus]|uniref:VOC family protein n=1 Tax=Halorussus TaxID=1070314 RepID=UPI0020A11CB8|nr:VOC family protein [Halorussus vallis]USZ77331.1 VOC family protein [Halorussus vallis]
MNAGTMPDDAAGLLDHVELYASDFEASVDFWGWFLDELGYETYQSWLDGRSWKRGPTYLVVVRAPEEYADEPYHRRRPGLNHLAFRAESREQVDELTEKLRERGRTVLYEDDHPYAGGEDHYAVYFEDPERIKAELVAPEREE